MSGIQEVSRFEQEGSHEPIWDLGLRYLLGPLNGDDPGAGIHKSLEFKSPAVEGASPGEGNI